MYELDFENSNIRFLWSGFYSKLTNVLKKTKKMRQDLEFNYQENQGLRLEMV